MLYRMSRLKEYGGYLPLELNPGEEPFFEYEEHLRRFNSAKAALCSILTVLSPKELFLPVYYCPSTIKALRRTGIPLRFYHIGEALRPKDIPDRKGCAVLLVDYFGVKGTETEELAASFQQAEVFIDRAHGFFEKPLMAERVYNIYSARKFFGVPDGAYLIGSDIKSLEESGQGFPSIDERAKYLLVSFEEGTNAAYSMKKKADHFLAEHYGAMSALSIGLLRNVDCERVKILRERNYRFLYKEFLPINALVLPENSAAYLFPLFLPGTGHRIKQELVKKKIYVPTLWEGEELKELGNESEHNMSTDCVFLPVDQRYREEDMEYIAQMVKSLL